MNIYIDEATGIVYPKWYRHPIAWWRWRRLTQKWRKDSKIFYLDSTPKGKNPWKS